MQYIKLEFKCSRYFILTPLYLCEICDKNTPISTYTTTDAQRNIMIWQCYYLGVPDSIEALICSMWGYQQVVIYTDDVVM